MNASLLRFLSLPTSLFASLLFAASAFADLVPFYQDSGKISVSVDANGNNNSEGGTIRVEKPTGATVRKAFLIAASWGGRLIKDGDVILNNASITWDKSIFNNLGSTPFFNNTLADVTLLLKDQLNNAAPGINTVSVKEINTWDIDGEILIVIFNDPNQIKERGVILFFGKQNTLGDSFIINLSSPINVSDPDAIADAGLGISYGYQGTTQYSVIDVNGSRLTSSAGGQDDGIGENGGLITVGGIDDTNDNPSPFAPPSGPRTDDELYNLKPFMKSDDKSILFNTINPSNDDNILFAYFKTSVPSAVLPPLTPPGPRSLNTSDLIGHIDSNKPTIVLTHGLQEGPYDASDPTQRTDLWTSFAENKAGALILAQLGTGVNILQYTWEEAFHGLGLTGKDYIQARENVADAAANLAKRLFEELGPGYSQPIHFIGHSLGTAVNAYAAREFLNLQPGVKKAQVTILDYPNLIENIPGIGEKEADIYGFDENFFASVLPVSKPGLEIRVDNYFVKPEVCFTCTGVGTAINGPVYNHLPLDGPKVVGNAFFKDESVWGYDNDHSGVQQWYRWTINPNGFGTDYCYRQSPFTALPEFFIKFDDSLDPCIKGWYWSINGPKPAPFPDKFPKNNGGSISTTNLQALIIDNFTDYGCHIDQINTVQCEEKSSPFGVADIDIPENTQYLSFRYLFTNIGDGDYIAIFIDDKPIWVLSGQSAMEGLIAESGPIPVRGLSGKHKMMVALYGVGEKNAKVEISDFKVFGVEVSRNNPPVANAGLDKTVYLGEPVTLDGSESSDPDNDTLTYLWTQVSEPFVSLVGEKTARPTFTPTAVGTYTFTLTVSDGELTASDNVNVNVVYKFGGFFQPIDNQPAWNKRKAGSAVPVKFNLDGNQGMAILDGDAPMSVDIPCSNMIGVGIPERVATAGNSGLNYDPTTDTYNYIWKTDKAWAETCRQLTVKLIDGTSHKILFNFTK